MRIVVSEVFAASEQRPSTSSDAADLPILTSALLGKFPISQAREDQAE
jgi:hypothetical protein